MSSLVEKAAYLKGLADGLDYDKNTKEGKLIAALIDMVDELAKAQDETDSDLTELNDYIEEIDSDLADVEECVYGDEDEDEEDEYCDGDCANCEDPCDDFESDEDDDDCDGDCEHCTNPCEDDFFEVVCPSCGETVCVDQSVSVDNLRCPACGEKFECIMEEDDYKKVVDEDEK